MEKLRFLFKLLYNGVLFPFDTAEFWQVARRWIKQGHTIIISEYQSPTDFVCVQEYQTTTGIRTTDNGRETRIERLFMHESQAHLFNERVIVQQKLFE